MIVKLVLSQVDHIVIQSKFKRDIDTLHNQICQRRNQSSTLIGVKKSMTTSQC